MQDFLLRGEQILYPVQILVTNVRLFGDNAQTRAGHIAEHTVKRWPVGIVLCGVIFNRYGTGDAAAVKRLLQKRHAGGHKLAADKLAFVLHGLGQRQAFAARRSAEVKHLLPRACIHTKGGEWFESYCVRLLRAYYLSEGKLVDEGFVTGGSDDGGIDGVIHTTDDLGYRETVLMQMKNRHAVMTAKDVREFYGAVCAENGSRGIFITLSSFHPEAQKLLDKVDNLTGVNGDKLFEIARRCKLGLLEKSGRLCIDEALLLNT